ncbi:MAG: Asp-tRNA(Asn)/Glu-tRNA(Gln) amidotransferase GatCAB subunit B, partial [Elusimicrobia bacterium]|nr:Asp-tRNA(Asn)/Glu-tRNA(Gln) amidotransferase GatCAB subunit B [Elusimicrobiota bacterium]
GYDKAPDAGALDAAIEAVLSANPKEVEAYKGGRKQLLGFFTGQVMKATGGKANPQALQAALKEKLG